MLNDFQSDLGGPQKITKEANPPMQLEIEFGSWITELKLEDVSKLDFYNVCKLYDSSNFTVDGFVAGFTDEINVFLAVTG